MPTLAELFATAIQHHQAGRLQSAEQIYRQILAYDPAHADAWHLLGLLAHQVGKQDPALEYIRYAIRLNPDVSAYHSNLGVVYRAMNNLEEAAACWRRAVELSPNNVDALNNLGHVLREQRHFDQAMACHRRALEVDPNHAATHYNLGIALSDQEKLDEAAACFRRALTLKPDYAEAHNSLGFAFRRQGRLDDAVACYRRALELKSAFAEAHNNLGSVWQIQGKLPEAIACFRRARELKPDMAEAHSNLGNALREQGKLGEAVACCRRAVELGPTFAGGYNNLGAALIAQGQIVEATACFQRVRELNPASAEVHFNLAGALRKQGRLDEAAAAFRQALQLRPDYADAHDGLGNVLQDQGQLDDAVACYRRALDLEPNHPEAHFDHSLVRLLRGDFEQGWAEYQWRWQTKTFRGLPFRQPSWDGQPLEGRTILLHAEQGLGDTIQFIRYAPLVKQRGARVVVQCQRLLLRLLAGCQGIDELIGQGDPLPAFDLHAPLLNLPGIFRTALDNVPATTPYLFAPPPLAERWRQELGKCDGVKIGIGWQGRPTHLGDSLRSIPLARFEPLTQIPGVHLISLQKGAGVEQLQDLAGRLPITEVGSRLEDFVDTAAVMSSLDLVIACDTSLVHLAGALGVPVWVALPLSPDWRWLLDRSDSPWYPTMRLFRQKRLGDWVGVFDEIKTALGEWIAAGPPRKVISD